MSDRIPLDAYYTPPELTRALLSRLGAIYPMTVAEPCAGQGWIARELLREGHDVITGDVADHPKLDHPGLDFLHPRAVRAYQEADAVITNPPFSAASEITRQALTITPRVAMLLRLTFLEPCLDRVDLLQSLARVIVLPRVSFITPGYPGKAGTDSTTCAWFLWGCERAPVEVVTKAELERLRGQMSFL